MKASLDQLKTPGYSEHLTEKEDANPQSRSSSALVNTDEIYASVPSTVLLVVGDHLRKPSLRPMIDA